MPRILIVNDEVDLLEICTMVLGAAGHEARSLNEGRRVQETAIEFAPDLVILDWVIPHMAGDEVLRRLRADPKTRAIPILMMSASHKAREAALAIGADSFIAKPFTGEELLREVDLVLGGATKRRRSAP